MKIQLDALDDSADNVRRAAPMTNADAVLAKSLAAIGLINPITVRPNGTGRYAVIAGARRLRAARSLGWTEIECATAYDSAASTLEISAAENFARVGMEPVDQWRAVADICKRTGLNPETAALSIGIAPALARRLAHLGNMAPEIIEAIRGGDLPSMGVLRDLSNVDHATQRAALERGLSGPGTSVNWWQVQQACIVRRLCREDAIFDTSILAWDEDLFAEPDDAGRFSTTDVDGFMAAQWAALRAEAAKSKGRLEVIEPENGAHITQALPKGWNAHWEDIPKRWRKDDPRKAFACVSRNGKIVRTLAVPAPERPGRADQGAIEADAAPERSPFQKATLHRIAQLKAESVRQRLQRTSEHGDPGDLLRAMLLMTLFQNVRVPGHPAFEADPRALLIDASGKLRALDDREVCQIAAQIIAGAISFASPLENTPSGPAADWLGRFLMAEKPRIDDAESLKGVSGDELRAQARAAGLSDKGTVGELRKRLADALPEWRPFGFDAPGPIAQPEPEADADDIVLPGEDDASDAEETQEGELADADASMD